MTDATATFQDVPLFDGRVLPLADCRRILRRPARALIISLATIAAVGVLVAIVIVAAGWLLSVTLKTGRHAKTPFGMATSNFAYGHPPLNGATHLSSLPRISVDSDGRLATLIFDLTNAARADSRFILGAEAIAPQGLIGQLNNESSPSATSEVAQSGLKGETLTASMHVAALNPAAAPASAPDIPPSPQVQPGLVEPPPLPRPHPAKRELARSAPDGAPQIAMATPPSASMPKAGARQKAHNKSRSLPRFDSRTAVYDIAASTVHLPNGQTLEAHSGFGSRMDDPRYAHVKNRGPTPPNVYELTLRERLFHGVQAIRLNPVHESKMFGRNGMLAHSYLLGPNGQSHGCVSFKDYRKFLSAFMKGEIDRLVVVSSLGNASWRMVSAGNGRALGYADDDR